MFRPPLLLAAIALATPALAQDPPAAALPTLARGAAAPGADADNPWKGFSFGSEAIVAARGGRGRAGGAAFVGYERPIGDMVSLGLRASAGHAPLAFHRGMGGADFAAAQARLTLDMGRFRPFVGVGVAAVKYGGPSSYSGPWSSVNDVFDGFGRRRTVGSVEAGFDYQITPSLSFGLAVRGYAQP